MGQPQRGSECPWQFPRSRTTSPVPTRKQLCNGLLSYRHNNETKPNSPPSQHGPSETLKQPRPIFTYGSYPYQSRISDTTLRKSPRQHAATNAGPYDVRACTTRARCSHTMAERTKQPRHSNKRRNPGRSDKPTIRHIYNTR